MDPGVDRDGDRSLEQSGAGAVGQWSAAARVERGVLISSGFVAVDAIIGLLIIGLIGIAHIQ